MIVFRSRHQGHHFLSLTTNHREPPLYGSSCDSGSLRPSLGRTWWAVKRATYSARSVGNSHRSTESAPACKRLRSPLAHSSGSPATANSFIHWAGISLAR